MTFPVQVGPSSITINRDDQFLVCQPDGRILGGPDDGFFTRDTRFISGWDLRINGKRPVLLNSAPIQFFSARFEYTNESFIDNAGRVDRQTLGVRVDRTVSGGIHEDLDITNYGAPPGPADDRGRDRVGLRRHLRRPVGRPRPTRRAQHPLVPVTPRAPQRRTRTRRSGGSSSWPSTRPTPSPSTPTVTSSSSHRSRRRPRWHTCLRWLPITQSDARRPGTLGCNAVEPPSPGTTPRLPEVTLETSNDTVRRAWQQAVRDMEALRLEDPTFERGVYIPAAGVPWYVTLFGRDTLVVSMQTISGYPEFAAGALRRLGAHAGRRRRSRAGHGAGQDPARGPPRGARPARDPAVPAVLRHPRRDEPLPDRLLVPLPVARRRRGPRALPAERRGSAALDRPLRRPRPATASRSTRPAPRTATTTRAGRTPATRSRTRTGRLRRCPSRRASSRATSSTRSSGWVTSTSCSAGRPTRAGCGARRRSCTSASTRRSGGRRRGPTTSASTAPSGRSGASPPTPATCSSPASCPPERAGRVVERLLAEDMWSGWGIRTLFDRARRLQPVQLPHGHGLAPRQRDDRAAASAATASPPRPPASRRACSTRPSGRSRTGCPELFAGLPRRRGELPGPVPRGERAAGLGGRLDPATDRGPRRHPCDVRPGGLARCT